MSDNILSAGFKETFHFIPNFVNLGYSFNVMFPEKPRYINAGGKLMDLATPRVMGILNITPDSFYHGSRYKTERDILNAAGQMLEDGADILDLGGYSSRPGANDVSCDEESKRVLKAVKLVRKSFPEAIISIDTFRAEIAFKAVREYGANIINDISACESDGDMLRIITDLKVPYVLMHMKGTPRTMQDNPVYEDVVAEILKWFGERIVNLNKSGVKDLIIDPGFGFGKTIEHNFELLRKLDDFIITGMPVMVGISRKSMIWKTLNINSDEALNGTTILNTIALLKGADILRVHDVKEAAEVVKLICKLRQKTMA